MAVPRRIPVAFSTVFPAGAFVVGVEPVNDYDKIKSGAADPQQRDEETGQPMWAVRVVDGDPEARTTEMKVRMIAAVQPVPPDLLPGTPFRPVEFDQLTVLPYIDRRVADRPRVAYSLRAGSMRAPGTVRRGNAGVAA
ncbi:hypothetical protein CcI6DRAFT_00521 [Frankia sp. CcI6]|uniref:hypothetical protein n=1 Tax=Frankia TaxID=1854 RepID=UPI0003CF9DFA|nr:MULTISPECIES: hypothetical protein [Frankia]ETA03997.1 hypothetical protein CcI6DRAFT_00521 [Frankia sp. CcI6]KFB06895.1 hypothetical protein ALLO2DRAFT_00183 [Frankia sp. Allo2]OAA30944.1 hypothetical protein AAY23_100432 [Frankia casuarinae]OHV54950.1 plasmid replication, integration and excision activator [Frankia sp. CgIS1]ORT51523.1 plasmid replication, integration and excision activator [Frankia sp. KB5]